MRRIFQYLLATLLLIAPARAGEKYPYPPGWGTQISAFLPPVTWKVPSYPDVWGRELPKVAKKFEDDANATLAFTTDDGEIYLYPDHDFTYDKPKEWIVPRLSFFSGDITQASHAEIQKWRKKMPDFDTSISLAIWTRKDIGFSVGTNNIKYSKLNFDINCLGFSPVTVTSKAEKGELSVTRLFFRINHGKIDYRIHSVRCGDSRYIGSFSRQVTPIEPKTNITALLPDGTIIAIFDNNYVVRLDKNLQSPFIDRHPDLFSFEYEQDIRPILEDANHKQQEQGLDFDPQKYVYEKVTEKVLIQREEKLRKLAQ